MSRLPRKNALSMGDILKDFIRANHLTKGINSRCIFTAWDEVSGAGRYTIKRFFRDGKLYITVNSSVVRSQLLFQKESYMEKINARLAEDRLFDASEADGRYVKELIIK